jgi:signal transduction histidine kinase
VVLDGAMGITEAARGALWLREGEQLVVAASEGLGAPDVGVGRPVGSGEIGRIAVEGDVALIGDGPSGVCAPIVIRGERVGVLVVERASGSAPFSDREITLARLFAEQAAVAVANATSYERERLRVETLVDAAEQRSDFVARMVHDLRAPLAAASGYAQLIRDRSDRLSPDQLGTAVDGVLEQTERLGGMIGEVLTASSVEAGAEVRRDPVDLAVLLEEVAKVGMAAAEGRGDRREIAVRDGHEAGIVLADPEALRHVFTNLVDNAMKYSPSGTGIRLMVEDLGDAVEVHVVDRGQGIAEEDLPTLFERFRQADGRRSGVGLGLYIVRTLVRAHGGEVSVRSKLGAGTAFTIHLPRRPLTEG